MGRMQDGARGPSRGKASNWCLTLEHRADHRVGVVKESRKPGM